MCCCGTCLRPRRPGVLLTPASLSLAGTHGHRACADPVLPPHSSNPSLALGNACTTPLLPVPHNPRQSTVRAVPARPQVQPSPPSNGPPRRTAAPLSARPLQAKTPVHTAHPPSPRSAHLLRPASGLRASKPSLCCTVISAACTRARDTPNGPALPCSQKGCSAAAHTPARQHCKGAPRRRQQPPHHHHHTPHRAAPPLHTLALTNIGCGCPACAVPVRVPGEPPTCAHAALRSCASICALRARRGPTLTAALARGWAQPVSLDPTSRIGPSAERPAAACVLVVCRLCAAGAHSALSPAAPPTPCHAPHCGPTAEHSAFRDPLQFDPLEHAPLAAQERSACRRSDPGGSHARRLWRCKRVLCNMLPHGPHMNSAGIALLVRMAPLPKDNA